MPVSSRLRVPARVFSTLCQSGRSRPAGLTNMFQRLQSWNVPWNLSPLPARKEASDLFDRVSRLAAGIKETIHNEPGSIAKNIQLQTAIQIAVCKQGILQIISRAQPSDRTVVLSNSGRFARN